MRLFCVVLFILFNIYLIESKSNNNRTEGDAEKLIKFRGDKNEKGVEGNGEEKNDETTYEEYEYSDDGTLDNNILGKGERLGDKNSTETLTGEGGESFPNEVFLSLRNITADAATAFRSFTNKNTDLLASASDNLNVTFNGTSFHDNESGGINRALRDTGHPSEIIAVADISPTYQPYTHKKIDTAELSDCALQGEWKPIGVAHQHITVESDGGGGSQHEQLDVLQSVGSYAVPNKIVPYWQNNFASGSGGVKVPQNHKPFGAHGGSGGYGSAHGSSGGYGGAHGSSGGYGGAHGSSGGYGGAHGSSGGYGSAHGSSGGYGGAHGSSGGYGGAHGSSSGYGSAYGYGAYDSGSNAGIVHLHANGLSSAGQFQKIKSSSMLSPPPYPPIIIGKKPGFYKSQKSKYKFYGSARPRPSGYSIGGGSGYSGYGSGYGSSSYASDVKGGSFGGYLNLNNGGGLGGGYSLGSGSIKQGGGGFSSNLYGNGASGGSYGLNQYGSGGNLEIHLGSSNSGKTGGYGGVKGGSGGGGGGGGFSVFAHNSNFGNSHETIKDLLHYGTGGGGGGVGGKEGSGNGGAQFIYNQGGGSGAAAGGAQVLIHQGGGTGAGTGAAQVVLHQGGGGSGAGAGAGAGATINLVETSHVDLLHPGNQGLEVSGLIQDDSNKVVGNLDVISQTPSSDILHHGSGGASAAYTQDVSASNVIAGHSGGLLQSGSAGGSLSLQQDSFGSIAHSGGVDLLHPGGVALVPAHPQSSALQSGEIVSGSTISSSYGLASSGGKDIGIGLSSGFNKGIATGNLIAAGANTFSHGSNVDVGVGNLLLSTSGIGQAGHSGSSYLTANLGQLSQSVGEGVKLIPDPAYLKSYYGQSTRGGNSLSDSAYLSSQINQDFHFHGQDPSTFTCGKNHDHNTNYHTATFQVADNDHPSSVDVLQYQGDAAVLIKAESVPFQDKVLPERKNYNSLDAEPSSEIISQTAPLSASVEQETGQTENEPTKAEDDEEPEHKSYYHEVTKVTKIPATSVGNIQYSYSEYDTKPQTFTQETELSNEEQETERPQIIKELEQLTNKFQLDPDNPQKLFEDPQTPTTQEVNYPVQKDEHHHEEAERYHYTSQDYTVKNQAHDFVTEFPGRITSSPPVQLIYKKPHIKYYARPGHQKPTAAYFPTKVPVGLLRKQKPNQFGLNQNYKVQELGGELHRPLGEIFPTQKSPKQFYIPKPNFAVDVPKGGFPKGPKSGYQVNFSNGKVIKKITTTTNRQKTLGPILVQKHSKLPPQVIRVVKVSV